MSALELATAYIQANIGAFHQKRLERLETLQLRTILKRKNPYLFRAKHVRKAQELVDSFLDAHLSSQEETMFGDFLEGLAIHLNSEIYGGSKSAAEGIDLEFSKDSIRYIVSIKSGPNWGNSSQVKKMLANFNRARKVIRMRNSGINIRAVNGCCYGRDDQPEKEAGYLKLCGQRFWEFISGDAEIYKKLVEPLGHEARAHNDDFVQRKAGVSNRFTKTFIAEFCNARDEIDWQRLVVFNSGSDPKTV